MKKILPITLGFRNNLSINLFLKALNSLKFKIFLGMFLCYLSLFPIIEISLFYKFPKIK